MSDRFAPFACRRAPFAPHRPLPLVEFPNLAHNGGEGFGIIGNIGGWLLVAPAPCAYHAGMAMAVNSAWRRTVMPIGGQPEPSARRDRRAIPRLAVAGPMGRAIVAAAPSIAAGKLESEA